MPDYSILGSCGAFGDDLEGAAFFPDGSRIRYGKRCSRTAPKEVQRRLTSLGGTNLYGEPNLRLIWSEEPTSYLYNPYERVYEKRSPYPNLRRWVVERWAPPRYSPDSWRWNFTQNVDGTEVDLLGPYPSRGEYEHLVTVERAHVQGCQTDWEDFCECGGGYQELTPYAIELLMRAIRDGQNQNAWQKRADVYGRIEAAWEAPDAVADAIVNDRMRAFKSRQFVVNQWKGDG